MVKSPRRSVRSNRRGRARLKQLLASGAIGWAGGGPPASACLDTMTYSQAESVFESFHRQTADALGAAPPVYGRFSGATPSDLTAALVRLGYCGMIPIDFAGGSGFGDEAKVILQAAGSQLEALTAKPMDASQDASFLTLGTRLGESIDSGEIATALLVHWPGQTCDAFEDLKRVATWSLCLGRFWNLADYFQKGEHPYHHGTASSSSPRSAELLASLVSAGTADPLSQSASAFCQALREEQQAMFAGMRELVVGPSGSPASKARFRTMQFRKLWDKRISACRRLVRQVGFGNRGPGLRRRKPVAIDPADQFTLDRLPAKRHSGCVAATEIGSPLRGHDGIGSGGGNGRHSLLRFRLDP